jgi:hypothetical protein
MCRAWLLSIVVVVVVVGMVWLLEIALHRYSVTCAGREANIRPISLSLSLVLGWVSLSAHDQRTEQGRGWHGWTEGRLGRKSKAKVVESKEKIPRRFWLLGTWDAVPYFTQMTRTSLPHADVLGACPSGGSWSI